MRNELHHYMLAHPVNARWTTRMYHSIFTRNFAAGAFSAPAYTFTLSPVFSVAALVLCVTLGTSYVAENSLPGQTLYAVKTRVNEPIQGAMALSNVSQVQWSSQLVDRRLSEAESLAQTGQLTPVNQMIIQTAIQNAAEDFDSRLSSLAPKDPHDIESVRFNFEQSLDSHESVLSAIGASSSSVDDALRPLLAIVRSHGRNKNRHGTTVEAAEDTSATAAAAPATTRSIQESRLSKRNRDDGKHLTSKQRDKHHEDILVEHEHEHEAAASAAIVSTSTSSSTPSLSHEHENENDDDQVSQVAVPSTPAAASASGVTPSAPSNSDSGASNTSGSSSSGSSSSGGSSGNSGSSGSGSSTSGSGSSGGGSGNSGSGSSGSGSSGGGSGKGN